MQIVATFDTSASSAPADFRAAVQAACDFFDRTFSNNVTVNVIFAWSNLGITGSVAQNTAYGFDETYSSTRNALAAHAAQTPGLSSLYLPTANPFVGNSGQLFVTTAEAKVLGLESYTGTDGICTLNSALSYNFDPSVAAVPGKYGAVTSI